MRLKTYRFFNMGIDHNYLDDARNRTLMQRAAAECYLPMNDLLLELIKSTGGRLRVSFYISGTALEQMRSYAPDVLRGFRKLAATGCAEFVGGTYSYSLAALAGREEFTAEVQRHAEMIREEFGQTPDAFFNTAMLYSDSIGETVASLGYKTMLAEGAKHLLGWKSPNYVYAGATNQKLRLLLRNYRLSDDLAFRFSDRRWSEWPLTADKFLEWIAGDRGEVVNLCTDYEAFGSWQRADTGIFDFLRAFAEGAAASDRFEFATVSESAARHQPVGVLYANHEVTWADEERDLSAWLATNSSRKLRQTLCPGRKRPAARRPRFQPRLEFPADGRQLLLDGHQMVHGRRPADRRKPLSVELRGIHQLHERPERLHQRTGAAAERHGI